MNKIWKTGHKWRRLPRRVSPLLNTIQALAATAAVVVFLMLFKYREETAPEQLKPTNYTAYIPEGHMLLHLAEELDPASFLHDNPGKMAVPQHIYESSDIKLELPRPERSYPLPNVAGFKPFAVEESEAAANMVVLPPDIKIFRKMPETQCIMYDRFGKERARWKNTGRKNLQNVLFRIEGEGIFHRGKIISSSGSNEVDSEILRKAEELHLPGGLYSVIHPETSEKGE